MLYRFELLYPGISDSDLFGITASGLEGSLVVMVPRARRVRRREVMRMRCAMVQCDPHGETRAIRRHRETLIAERQYYCGPKARHCRLAVQA